MINLHWLKLPMAGTIYYGPKDVRAIEVWLYNVICSSLLSTLGKISADNILEILSFPRVYYFMKAFYYFMEAFS